MFKKSLLVLALLNGQISKSKNSDTLPSLAVVAAFGGIVYVHTCCKSNILTIASIQKADAWFNASQAIQDLYKIKTSLEMEQYVETRTDIQKQELLLHAEFVEFLYARMNADYNSWLKPWNWNQSMQEAFLSISKIHTVTKLFTLMVKYVPFVSLCNLTDDQNVTMDNVKLLTQEASAYPMLSCADVIKNDLSWLKQANFECAMFDAALIELLENLLIMVVSHPIYIQEKQCQKEMSKAIHNARFGKKDTCIHACSGQSQWAFINNQKAKKAQEEEADYRAFEQQCDQW